MKKLGILPYFHNGEIHEQNVHDTLNLLQKFTVDPNAILRIGHGYKYISNIANKDTSNVYFEVCPLGNKFFNIDNKKILF